MGISMIITILLTSKEAIFTIEVSNDRFTYQIKPKLLIVTELCVGNVKIPVKTELDFSMVDESQHEKMLEIGLQIYGR